MRNVGALLRQFGPSTGGLPGPASPTFTVVDNGDGTATVTISGTDGATHTVYVIGPADTDWRDVGSDLDGTGTEPNAVTFSIISGRYFIYVLSDLNDQEAVSIVKVVWFEIEGEESGDLAHSPADIVRRLLISQGKGSDPEDGIAWPIYTNNEPNTPDNCITTYDTSGILEGRIQYSGEMSEHFGFQIRVRSVNHIDGWRKIHELKKHLDQGIQLDTITIDSSIYLVEAITRSGGILALGKESPTSQRLLFTLNAIVALRQLG